MSNDILTISRDTTKRLLKDVKEMIKNPLNDDGIYYKHDEENILHGYVYISGPSESKYVGGAYFFKFTFPYDYPHKPPIVEFKTSDSITRFHPNMYRNGKMCLSLLNTWKGDQWTGCQSIRTILLTIISIMDNNPLLHEPGFTIRHKEVELYNEIILFRNLDFCVVDILNNNSTLVKNMSHYIDLFKEEIMIEFNKKKEEISNILEEKKDEENKTIKTGIYNIKCVINWNNLWEKFNLI